MYRVHLIGLVSLGMFSAVADGATTVVDRDQVVQTWLNVARRDAGGGGTTHVQQDVYFDTNGANTIAPDLQTTSANGTGALNDTATDSVLVAEGSGSGVVATTLAYNGLDLASYAITGSLAASFQTETLAGYQPTFPGPEVNVQAVTVSNAAFSFTTNVPVPYSISASQFNTVGTLFSGARLFLDVNGDQSFNVVDGDISIENVGLSADGSETHTGVLLPSVFEYRVFYSANTFGATISDNKALASSGQFAGNFTVVPEPAALSMVALAGLALRRRQISHRANRGANKRV